MSYFLALHTCCSSLSIGYSRLFLGYTLFVLIMYGFKQFGQPLERHITYYVSVFFRIFFIELQNIELKANKISFFNVFPGMLEFYNKKYW